MTRPSCIYINRDPEESLSVNLNPAFEPFGEALIEGKETRQDSSNFPAD